MDSNCGSRNCSSRQKCIPRPLSSAPGVSKIGIDAMSRNGCFRSGAQPSIQASVAERKRQAHCSFASGSSGRESINFSSRWYNAPPRGNHGEPDCSSPATEEGKKARARRTAATRRGIGGSGKSRRCGRKVRGSSGAQDAEANVNCCA
jgi:hypothetical protein